MDSKTQLTRDQLHHLDGKTVPGSTGLRGGMALGTQDMPKAAGRAPDDDARLSFSFGAAATKILSGEIMDAILIGTSRDTDPAGVHVVLKDKSMSLWAVTRKHSDGSAILDLAGSTMGTSVFSYFGGMAVAAFILMNHHSYPDVSDALGAAHDAVAAGDDSRVLGASARLADELTFACERMLDGTDPLNIRQIYFGREEPKDFDQIFAGGDALKEAFANRPGLEAFMKTKAKPVTFASAVYGDDTITTSFIGELPKKLRDSIRRGKHVLLTGPTATGKTTCAEEVCLAMAAPYVLIRGYEGLEDRDVIAAVALVDGNTVTTYGPLPEAMKLGYAQYEKHLTELSAAQTEGRDPNFVPPAVLILDEVNRLQPRYQNFFVSAMNVRSGTNDYYLRIPDTNEEITCPVGFFAVIAARNFGASYIGINPMDLAFERRFHKKIEVAYLEADAEIGLLKNRTGIDDLAAKVLVRVANDSRTQLAQLRAPVDTDTLLKWSEEVAYAQRQGIGINEQIIIDLARDTIFSIVLERTERGEYDPAGEAVMTDNISEACKEVYAA